MRNIWKITDESRSKKRSMHLVSTDCEDDYQTQRRQIIAYADGLGVSDEGRCVELVGSCLETADRVVCL